LKLTDISYVYLEEVAISAFLIPISDFKQKTRNLHINAPLIWFANRHFNNRRSLLLKKKEKKKKQSAENPMQKNAHHGSQ